MTNEEIKKATVEDIIFDITCTRRYMDDDESHLIDFLGNIKKIFTKIFGKAIFESTDSAMGDLLADTQLAHIICFLLGNGAGKELEIYQYATSREVSLTELFTYLKKLRVNHEKLDVYALQSVFGIEIQTS